ncbi:hypothetical protein [Porticoccus sp.]
MKKTAAKYRTVVAALLMGWILLCGLMPLLPDKGPDAGMDHAAHQMMASHQGDGATDAAGASHCCDALQGHQLPVQYPFMDLLAFAIVGCLLFLLAAVLPSPPRLYYAPVPPTGPPLHQRYCVWLD